MSVLIQTITNLPEHCYDCPCHNGESGYCQADKEYKYSIYRPSWCPLLEIPPVTPQPKTGHWIYHYSPSGMNVEHRECSSCGVWFEYNMPRNSFCPNCGAKMESEVKK